MSRFVFSTGLCAGPPQSPHARRFPSWKRAAGWMALCLLFFSGLKAQAQTGLTLQLVPEVTAIVPGQPFRAGVFIRHEPGWHTYWRQPGIVGVPTTLEWQLPAGFKAGELEYPEPESVLMFHIKAQGYERDVLLQTVITPPADLKPGGKMELRAKAAWMCCGNTCHPGFKELRLTLPVAAEHKADAKWQPVFARERAAFVRTSEAWTAEATEKGLRVTLHLHPGPGARPFEPGEKILFFTEDGWINSDEPQVQERTPDGGLKMTLTRAEVFLGKTIPDKLHSVLQREGGWVAGESWRSLGVAPVLKRLPGEP